MKPDDIPDDVLDAAEDAYLDAIVVFMMARAILAEQQRRMNPDDPERIAAVAIHHHEQTYRMLPPARHADVLRRAHFLCPKDFIGPEEQGFVTTKGRFVGRKEGKAIAAAAGQLLPDASISADLFSEDMW